MKIVEDILQQIGGLSKPKQKFILALFSSIFIVCGQVNFTNQSRYSSLSEKTYRRHFSQPFPFREFNQYLIKKAISEHSLQILAIDCSFIPKSGKLTYGLDYFFNSSLGRAEKGLEISVISVIALEANLSYTLSVQQTPPKELESSDLNVQPQSPFKRENSRFPTFLTSTNTVPKASKAHQSSSKKKANSIELSSNQRKKITEDTESTRIDVYLAHLKKTKPYVPATIKYLVADGYYSKEKFVKGVLDLNFSLIGKLRRDANLRYLYTGQQKQRGARRK